MGGEGGTWETCQQGCGGSLQPRIASPSVSAEKMSQGWSQTRGWLRSALARHQLLFVNCGVSVGLSGLGDLLQQRIEQGRQTPRSSASLTCQRPLASLQVCSVTIGTEFLIISCLGERSGPLLSKLPGTRFSSAPSASLPAYLSQGLCLRRNPRLKLWRTRPSWEHNYGSPSGSSGPPRSLSTFTFYRPSTEWCTTTSLAFSMTGTPPILNTVGQLLKNLKDKMIWF